MTNDKIYAVALKAPSINRLLEGLPSVLRNRIINGCDAVNLEFGNILCEPNKPFKYVYFPLTSLISLVAVVDGHQPLEMGLIGNEGMLGASLSLGVTNAPMRALVQGSGMALRMNLVNLRRELRRSPALIKILNQYLYVLFTQLAKMTACIHFHEIEPRLARWLLMTQDRIQAPELHLTQEFLANMLGVRRSGVTVAAGSLQEKHLIQYTRGEILITDRMGLIAVACSCYQEIIDEYEQVLG